ncbi:Transport integral membrane protein OS=Streptomyces antimycoticus OX=68175 GN=SSPO_052090 PE=4 SV=1 [Streptomyces antimycoticus]
MPSANGTSPAGPTATPSRTTATARRLSAISAPLLAALLSAAGVGASSASAHAALASTDPADGSVRPRPQEVTLNFSEGVLLSGDSVRVLDQARGTAGRPPCRRRVTDRRRRAAAPSLRTAPTRWRGRRSPPSHRRPGPTTAKVYPRARRPTGAVSTLYGIGRYAAYGGFAALVGGSVFGRVLQVLPRRCGRRRGWVTVFTASLLLLLRGPYTNSEGIGGILDLGRLGEVLSTKPGAALLAPAAARRGGGLPGRPLRLVHPSRPGEREADGAGAARTSPSAWAMAVGLSATWAMAEHASVGLQRQLAVPVDMIHLIAVGVWAGRSGLARGDAPGG